MFRKTAIAIILSTLVTAAASADDLVVTSASVSPTSVLPAASVWTSIEVRNASDHPVALPTKYIIELTPPAGEPFLAWHTTSFVGWLPEAYELQPALAPGESRVIEFLNGAGVLAGGIFYDRRLWQPGTWGLRVILSNELRSDRLERVHWSKLMGSGFVTAPLLVTPMIRLTIEEPTGIDAEAWKALLALPSVGTLTGDRPKAGELGKQFWDKYRESRYAPYFGMAAARYILQTGGEDRFKVVDEIHQRVITLDRDVIFADDLRFSSAFRKAYDAGVSHDLATALQKTSDARDALETVTKLAKHELTRARARSEFRKLKSPEELKAFFATSTTDH